MFRLEGKVQHYAWGGQVFIPEFLGIFNTEKRPFAEYWMGVHPSAPARIRLGDYAHTTLPDLIRSTAHRYLGSSVLKSFHDLPYLLKVLDVKEMLSIQVHPSKEEATRGFDRENREGVPLDAPHRNYRDANHKPEMMVALSEFWLLHGFREEASMQDILSSVPEFHWLGELFVQSGYRGLYQYVMELPQDDIDKMLAPLAARVIPLYEASRLPKNAPDFWAARAIRTYPERLDRGIFSIYFFNLVKLEKGEAIFQGAGLPHAYLEGQNIELMSNSDNVLRGGLTPKHVDVPELMKHTLFESVSPKRMTPLVKGNEQLFSCPVPDFSLSIVTVTDEERFTLHATSPEIILILDGEGEIGRFVAKRGQSFFLTPGETVEIQGTLTLIRAFVP